MVRQSCGRFVNGEGRTLATRAVRLQCPHVAASAITPRSYHHHHRHCLTCNSKTDAFSHSNRLGERGNRILPHSVRQLIFGFMPVERAERITFMASWFRLFICQELYVVPKLCSPSFSQGCKSSILVIDFFQSRLLDRSDLCGRITFVS